MFTLITTYIKVTHDRSFLSELVPASPSIPASSPRQTILNWLTEMSQHGAKLELNNTGLADYGTEKNLLECVPSYIHAVPSLNAANVFMLSEMATVHKLLNGTDSAIAAKLTAMANKTLAAVIGLYVDGEGVFASLYPDGAKVQVRGVIDFHTVATLIPQHLTAKQVREMLAFVRTELGTSDWIRALSRLDPNANIASFRPDHGTIGSYDAWPAQVMQAQLTLGTAAAAADALAIVERIEPTTYEG